MKKLGLVALLVGSMTLAGCHASVPLQLVHESNMQNVDLGSGRIRKGTNCATYLLGFIGPFGQEGVVDIAIKNRIRRPMLQEVEAHNYILFQQVCMNVYGE